MRANSTVADVGLRALFTSASISVSVSVAAGVAGLFTTGVMARELSVDVFGQVVLLLTAVNALAILEGLRPIIVFRVTKFPSERRMLFRTSAIVNAIMASVVLGLLAVVSFGGWSRGTPPATLATLAATVVFFFAVMHYWCFLDAELEMVFTSVARSAAWTGLYGAFTLLAVSGFGVTAFAVALLLMYVVTAAAMAMRFYTVVPRSRYAAVHSSVPLRNILAEASSNILFNIFAVIINTADRAVIAFSLGTARAGMYAGPSELTLRSAALVRAAMQVVLPWAVRQSEAAGHRQRLWLSAQIAVVTLSLPVTALVFVLREPLAVLLLGERFRTSGDLLALFVLATVISTLGYINMAYLNARGDFVTQRRYYGWAAAVLLGGAAYGASIGSLVLIACAFVIARCVDPLIGWRILAECGRPQRARAAAIAAGTIAALGLAWAQHSFGSAVAVVATLALAYRAWRQLESN